MSMNYEKKYRNLVEAIKELQEANPSDDGIQKWVKENVPELMESEDERIRKEIINYFRCQSIDEPSRKDIHNKWIAWLEKQGEHKPADKIEQEYHCTGVREPKEATGVLKQLLNKENYAWSEEDEAYRIYILVRLDPHIDGENYIKIQNWFESIKDRVQPQPKQEWSKEDEENFARVDYACLKVYGGDSYSSDWLRKFLGIHKKWKPSDEQMKALADAITNGHLSNANERILKGLQEQLKKL